MRQKQLILVLFLMVFISRSTKAQDHAFIFGVQGSANLSQIAGDNLIGFKKLGYKFGLFGGYLLSSEKYLICSMSYAVVGSKRKGEQLPRAMNRVLAEIELQSINIGTAYSGQFGDTWEGNKPFRYLLGFKYNYILKEQSQTYSGIIGDQRVLNTQAFKSSYISVQTGLGFFLTNKFVLDIRYEHALQSILKEAEALQLTTLFPFHLGLSLSYYMN